MAKKMTVEQDKIIELFTELGFKTARKWDAKKLKLKVKKLPSIASDQVLEDEELNTLLEDICETIEGGGKVNISAEVEAEEELEEELKEEVIEDEEEEEKPVKKTTTKKSKKKETKEEKPVKKTTTKKSKKKEAKPKKEKGEKRPGVISTIIETLEKRHVTKEQLLDVLSKKFPDREPKGMKHTIDVQVPTGLLKRKEIKVQKDKNGKFYL